MSTANYLEEFLITDILKFCWRIVYVLGEMYFNKVSKENFKKLTPLITSQRAAKLYGVNGISYSKYMFVYPTIILM